VANLNFQPGPLFTLASKVLHLAWPDVEANYGDLLSELADTTATAGQLQRTSDAYARLTLSFETLQQRVVGDAPPAVQEWLDRKRPDPDAPDGLRLFAAKYKSDLYLRLREYREATEQLSNTLHAQAAALSDLDSTLSLHFSPSITWPLAQVHSGKGAWRQLAIALAADETDGQLYIHGDVEDRDIHAIESALARLVAAAGGQVEWGPSTEGSWWRRFKVSVASRINEADLDTIKRAGQVHLLDRHESEAAKNYADAIAALAHAVESQPHAYLAAKNVVLLKTINTEGESVVVSRVLTSSEVLAYEGGELHSVLGNPETALNFIQSGSRPISQALSTDESAE
jgi:hypothetical protein